MGNRGAFLAINATEAKLDLKDRHSGQAKREPESMFKRLDSPPSGTTPWMEEVKRSWNPSRGGRGTSTRTGEGTTPRMEEVELCLDQQSRTMQEQLPRGYI